MILWYKFLNKTKYVGHVITFPLTFVLVCMYMEGERERSQGGKHSQVEQREGDGRGTTKLIYIIDIIISGGFQYLGVCLFFSFDRWCCLFELTRYLLPPSLLISRVSFYVQC